MCTNDTHGYIIQYNNTEGLCYGLDSRTDLKDVKYYAGEYDAEQWGREDDEASFITTADPVNDPDWSSIDLRPGYI